MQAVGDRARAAWLVVTLGSAAACALAWVVARVMAAAPGDAAEFLEYAKGACRPEPVEQLAYVLAGAGASCFAWWSASRAKASWPLAWALPVQLAGLVLAFGSFVVEAWRPEVLFGRAQLAFAALAAVAALVFLPRSRMWRMPAWARWVLPAVALLAAAYALGPAWITGEGLDRVPSDVALHLPFTMGEFAAVGNGRTPLVDFFPQYVTLLPMALGPLLRGALDEPARYSTMMCVLSFVLLAATWWTLWRATDDRAAASILFLPVLGFFTVAIPLETEAGERSYAFDYFALAPLRLLLPSIAMACVVGAARRGGARAWLWPGLVAGLAAVNNPDFGLACLAATLATALASGARERRWKAAGAALAAALLGGATVLAWLVLRGGRMPRVDRALDFVRLFSKHGFMSLPMQPMGLPLLMFATFVGAIALSRISVPGRSEADERARAAWLVQAGLHGLGFGTYWAGRSHPYVLVGLLGPWSVALVAVAWDLWCRARACEGPGRAERMVPTVALAFLCALGSSNLAAWPSPDELGAHLTAKGGAWPGWMAKLADDVRAAARPGDAVAVAYADGHLIATRAGVRNVFPFAHQGSLILRAQVDEAMQAIEAHGVRRVFGAPPVEFSAALRAAGFSKVATRPAWSDALEVRGYPAFETWAR